MAELSVVVITKNEQDRIRRCLESVKWADEIIIVDALSTDRTVEICRSYTNRIFKREWDGFISQKNYALSLAGKDWILSIDADEQLSDMLIPEIKAVLNLQSHNCVAYSMPRRTYYLGRWMMHSGWYPDKKVRLIKKGTGKWGGTEPHDTLEVNGNICSLNSDILHYSFRDLSHHIKKLNYFTDSAAIELIAAKRHIRISDMLIHSSGMFVKMFLIKRGYKDGIQGFIAACVSAFHVFVKYAKAWERQQDKKAQK